MTSTLSRLLVKETPPSWIACDRCRYLSYRRRLERELSVCPSCGQHLRLSAAQRIRMLLDPGSAQPLTPAPTVCDPLGFTDTRDYRERLRVAQDTTGLEDTVLIAAGTLDGQPVVVAVMDFAFLGGSLGVAAGEAVVTAAEHALSTRTPLLLVTASSGARMQEGTLALAQMVKTSNAMAALDSAGILTISLITDPTYGGVAASFATLSDIVLCEPGARLGFAGPRVIEQIVGERLPEGFQTAEFLLKHGLVDDIRPRSELRAMLAVLLAAARRRATAAHGREPAAVVTDPEQLPDLDPARVVTLARHAGRPTMTDHLGQWTDGFVALHGDRAGGGDCPSIISGIGMLDGRGVMVIGHQKGHSTQELVERNFGMASPAGYRKAARCIRLAAKIGIPIVTLVDTPGAHPGLDAERYGQASAIAECLRVLGSVPVPVVSVITGEGGSGGALALASADRVLMCQHAIYSVISPEGCAAILWKDGSRWEPAARALGVDARSLLSLGVVDGVIDEPSGGAHTDPMTASLMIRDAVVCTLDRIEKVDCTERLRQRHHRYRRLGCDSQNGNGPMTEDNTAARAEMVLKALRGALVGVLGASPVIPARVRLSLNGAELDVSWHDLPIPTAPTVPVDESAQSATSQPDASADGVHAVRSPLVGTFYRAGEPGSSPFVEVGDVVTCGQQLAIVEAMKLMNSIEADCDGQVVEVPVPDGSPVEFDQPLVLIKPMQSGG